MFAAALPAIGAVAGGALNYFGQQSANRANVNMAREANVASAREAALQRDWEERMSNTSYQRAIEDMKKAGVNPMLMFSKGVGASTPSGASAQQVAGAPQQNTLSGFNNSVASAVQLASLKANLDKVVSDTELNKAIIATNKTQQGLNLANAATSAQQAANMAQVFKSLRLQGDIDDSKMAKVLEWTNRFTNTASNVIGTVNPAFGFARNLMNLARVRYDKSHGFYNVKTGELFG